MNVGGLTCFHCSGSWSPCRIILPPHRLTENSPDQTRPGFQSPEKQNPKCAAAARKSVQKFGERWSDWGRERERDRQTEGEGWRERERGRCSGVFVSLIRTLRRRRAVWSCRSLNVRRRSGVEPEQNTSGQAGKIKCDSLRWRTRKPADEFNSFLNVWLRVFPLMLLYLCSLIICCLLSINTDVNINNEKIKSIKLNECSDKTSQFYLMKLN